MMFPGYKYKCCCVEALKRSGDVRLSTLLSGTYRTRYEAYRLLVKMGGLNAAFARQGYSNVFVPIAGDIVCIRHNTNGLCFGVMLNDREAQMSTGVIDIFSTPGEAIFYRKDNNICQ